MSSRLLEVQFSTRDAVGLSQPRQFCVPVQREEEEMPARYKKKCTICNICRFICSSALHLVQERFHSRIHSSLHLPPGRLGGPSGMSSKFRGRSLGSAGRDVLGEGMWSELGKQQWAPPFQERIARCFH